jgi:hypothetical protein
VPGNVVSPGRLVCAHFTVQAHVAAHRCTRRLKCSKRKTSLINATSIGGVECVYSVLSVDVYACAHAHSFALIFSYILVSVRARVSCLSPRCDGLHVIAHACATDRC